MRRAASDKLPLGLIVVVMMSTPLSWSGRDRDAQAQPRTGAREPWLSVLRGEGTRDCPDTEALRRMVAADLPSGPKKKI